MQAVHPAALTLTLSRCAGEGKHSAGTRDARRLTGLVVCPLPVRGERVRVSAVWVPAAGATEANSLAQATCERVFWVGTRSVAGFFGLAASSRRPTRLPRRLRRRRRRRGPSGADAGGVRARDHGGRWRWRRGRRPERRPLRRLPAFAARPRPPLSPGCAGGGGPAFLLGAGQGEGQADAHHQHGEDAQVPAGAGALGFGGQGGGGLADADVGVAGQQAVEIPLADRTSAGSGAPGPSPWPASPPPRPPAGCPARGAACDGGCTSWVSTWEMTPR